MFDANDRINGVVAGFGCCFYFSVLILLTNIFSACQMRNDMNVIVPTAKLLPSLTVRESACARGEREFDARIRCR